MADVDSADCWHEGAEASLEICHGVFLYKKGIGPCVRCALILDILADKSLDDNTRAAKLAAVKEMRQCEGCSTVSKGLLLRMVSELNLCARCATTKGLIDTADAAARKRLTEKSDERFKRPSAPARPQSGHQPTAGPSSGPRHTPPITPSYLASISRHSQHHPHQQPFSNVSNNPLHTNEGLHAARKAVIAQHIPSTRAEYEVPVSGLPVLKGKNKSRFGKDTSLALCKVTYPDHWVLSDVCEDLLKVLNVSWTRISETKGKDLDFLEVDFHWGGTCTPIALPRSAFSMTLLDLLKTLNASKSTYTIEDKTKKKKLAAGDLTSIPLQMSILTDNFFARLEKTKGRKRSASSSIAGSSLRATKSALPSSVFASSLHHNASNIMSPVRFVLAEMDITPDLENFNIIFSFDDLPDESLVKHGFVSPHIHGKGVSKEVRKFTHNNTYYAVKKFYNLGHGTGTVSLAENQTAIEAEVHYILFGETLLREFYRVAEIKDLDLYYLLAFTTVDVLKDVDSGQLWMREPLRARRVTKISGTLVHPEPDRLPAETVYAFVHWVYEFTKGRVVFADMQMSIGQVAGEDGYHIFDPMVHTRRPRQGIATGVGDCGEDGVANWESQHRCIELCRQLGLGAIPFASEPAQSGGDDEAETDK